MKIAILLPYKENYSPNLSGAVSIHVSNLYEYSKFKKNIVIWGNTKSKKYLSKNYKNISIEKDFYLATIKNIYQNLLNYKKRRVKIIEIHNRPNYVGEISNKLKSKVILYFS